MSDEENVRQLYGHYKTKTSTNVIAMSCSESAKREKQVLSKPG